MLSRRQQAAVVVAALVAGALIASLGYLASKGAPLAATRPEPAKFDGASAVEFTRVLAEGYPDRVTGSGGARGAAAYLRSEFQKLGYRVQSVTFVMWLRGERVQGENVVASLPGEIPESVAVVAHYDGQTTSHQAAEDNASGVGVLLELARALRERQHHRSLILAATDAEEWGMIGARALTDYFKSEKTSAVISIDYLNSGAAPALAIDCMGQGRGYTPLWLRQVMVEAGKAHGAVVVEPSPAWEWIERALEVSAQDQGPLLHADIPALNISTLTNDYAASRARYHTLEDTFRHFDPASFRSLGATVEQAVLTLEAGRPLASNEMNYWRVSAKRYLPGWTLWTMQFLALAPFLLAGTFAGLNLRESRLLAATGILIRPAMYLVPPFLALLVLYALTMANVLKRYELYPATPKDAFLYEIPLRVVLPLALAFVAGYGIVRKVRGWLPRETQAFAVKKQVLYVWLAGLAVCSSLLNPFALWLYLGPFVLAALLLFPPSGAATRAFNALLLLAAALPFGVLLHNFGREIFLGWRIVWYLVLQAAYGVWSPQAAVVFLSVATVWVQFFSVSVLGRRSVVKATN